jgi:hypothetical protein
MPAASAVTLDVVIERKQPGLAAFVVVPAAKVARWKLSATTTIEGTLDGCRARTPLAPPLGRHALVRRAPTAASRHARQVPRATARGS